MKIPYLFFSEPLCSAVNITLYYDRHQCTGSAVTCFNAPQNLCCIASLDREPFGAVTVHSDISDDKMMPFFKDPTRFCGQPESKIWDFDEGCLEVNTGGPLGDDE